MRMMDFTVIKNEQIARGVFEMQLSTVNGQLSAAPGQFVNLQIDGHYLRRPISVCDWDGQALTLIYKVVGQGTARLARYGPGEAVNALTGLGNGYTVVPAERPLLLGGGVGVPPLYYLAKELVKAGQRPVALLGFNAPEDVFYQEKFERTCETIVVTGGFVTDAMPGLEYGALYTCGPEPMLRAAYTQANGLPPGRAQFSFERRMGCGFGACMVCSCRTAAGYKRVCKDGPILTKEEILWT
ncbi:MAG: dihydroorotate dehydrogenase electron transfer subunit [Oscillospiraceae bacterium]|jgi:dihydroorotate dehydrogenase electron transfer subunit|nr:dihydroorotate dehydrogenase electron transfer subunit [Oscillospiraceae bacterium]